MIRCALWSSFSRRVFSRSNLRTFSSRGFRSRLRPRFLDSAFRDPLRAALRHVVRCDEYKPSRRRSRPTSPNSVQRSASSTVRFFDDPQLVRRSEPAAERLIHDLRVPGRSGVTESLNDNREPLQVRRAGKDAVGKRS